MAVHSRAVCQAQAGKIREHLKNGCRGGLKQGSACSSTGGSTPFLPAENG